MKPAILAAIAAAAILGSSAVYAQPHYQARHQDHHHKRLSAEDRAAFVDARIAAVKAGLQLTPDQEKNWPAVETAVRDFAKQRIERAEARAKERKARRAERASRKDKNSADRAAPRQEADPLVRLHARADAMAATAAGLKRIADAADPLYRSLDDAQKRRLAMLTRRSGYFGLGHRREFKRHFERGAHDRGGRENRNRDHRPDSGQTERL